MSSRQRQPQQLLWWSLFHHLLLPWSSNCWDSEWGMTGVQPFQARVSGDLASKGILQPSTLLKVAGGEKTSEHPIEPGNPVGPSLS